MAKINIPSVNDKLLDKYIRHSVWMEQLKAGEAAKISRMLKKDVFPQLYDKLINELGKVKNLTSARRLSKIERIKQMMASVESTATAGAIRAGKLINQKMYNVAKFEAKWNVKTLEKTVPLDISLNTPSNAVLKQLVLASTFQGHRMQTWMKGYSKSVQAGIAKQLKIGVATGESLPAISKRLRKVLGSKAHQAETLARTSVSNIVHDAREATFKANKKLIRKVQMVATLDDKTTLICINYDGKVFNVGEGDRPPFHFNCRTTTVPVVTSWNEFGVVDPPAFTRASMNGAVPAKTNYRQWLKRQSKATQIKVLGKTRAELYRSGRVKINKFVGKDYKPLSLKQLAKKEGFKIPNAKVVKAKVSIPTISKETSALKISNKATAKFYIPAKGSKAIYDKALRLNSPDAKRMLTRAGKTKSQVYTDIVKNRKLSKKPSYTKEKYFGLDVDVPVKLKRIKLHDKLVRRILSKVKSTKNPKAILTGGLPGSGKTASLDASIPGWKKNYVHIDSDSIKLMLAKADGLDTLGVHAAEYHEEANLILSRVLTKAIKANKSILYDGTMRNSDRLNTLVTKFKRAGYDTTALYADLPLEKSMIRSIGRVYGKTSRFVDPMMQTTHGTKNIDTFNMLKNKVDDWKHYDTDVTFGDKPILIERK